jgi:hypothetical protein
MLEKDRVLRDLSAMIDEQGGSVAFVLPRRVSAPAGLEAAEHTVHAILEHYLAGQYRFATGSGKMRVQDNRRGQGFRQCTRQGD